MEQIGRDHRDTIIVQTAGIRVEWVSGVGGQQVSAQLYTVGSDTGGGAERAEKLHKK